MKVILVDDEPVMHLIMRKMLAKHTDVEVAGAFADTDTAASFLNGHADVELAFVDISMPGGNGLEFAAKLDEAGGRTHVVFVTSHKDFALEAYELSAIDYIVKPVTQERLERTIQRVMSNRNPVHAAKAEQAAASERSGGIAISTLGDFYVRNDSRRVKWISSKSAELFAYLLLNRGRWISRTRLVADIFGGMDGGNAEKYLNTTVYQMRKSLEPFGLRESIRSENDGYALELEGAVIDYEEFERLTARFGSIGEEEAEEAVEVERLYTGDLFGSKAYVWAIHETGRLSERYAAFVKRLAEALIALRNESAATKLLLKLLARNPLDESVVGMLMKLRAQAGDKKGLTVQYTEFVKLLGRELGIRPSKELLLLYDSLLSGMGDGDC
ncbi:response regulator [Cohnella suwonensis]|uniref:Response regulator n=1 Tax=Cohnella suwonensis TaxID=696072 RepID=A0ABW0LTD1_9BACL